MQGAVCEADDFLANKGASLERLARAADLIEGFETPYGMELLATVHWVTSIVGGKHGELPAADPQECMAIVHAWNPRKQRIFQALHIQVAWRQLVEKGWLAADTSKV